MPGSRRHGLTSVLALVALFGALCAGLAGCLPVIPPGSGGAPVLPRSAAPLPAGTLVLDADRTGHFEIYTQSPTGVTTQVTSTADADSWWARLSPDRRTIVFQRVPAGVHDRDYDQVELWAVAADGGPPVLLRARGQDGWVHQGHVEWAPDGAHLTLFGGTRYDTQIFLVDPNGANPRAVTSRPGANLDPSFLPGGDQIAFVGCPTATCYPQDYEIYTVAITGGTARRLTYDALTDHDPAVSADGQRLAWITQTAAGVPGSWAVSVASIDGGGARRVLDDGGVDGAPVWSGNGDLLVHRFPTGHTAFQVYRLGVDTGALTDLTGNPAWTNEYPSP